MDTKLRDHEWLEKNYNQLYNWINLTFGNLTFTAIDEITDTGGNMVILNIFTTRKSFNIAACKPNIRNPQGYLGLTYTNRHDGKGGDLEEASYSEGGWERILEDLLYTDRISFEELLEMFKKRES